MGKNGFELPKNGPAVLVGTYRPECWNFISKTRIYNLPFDEGDENALKAITHLVLFAKGRGGKAYPTHFSHLIDKTWLKKHGYPVSSTPHAKRYAIFSLDSKKSVAYGKLLSDKTSQVFVYSSRVTACKIDDEFYSKPYPDVGGESMRDVFDKLKPYYKKSKRIVLADKRLSQMLFDVMLNSTTIANVPFPSPKNPKFTFVDLFAGIGGFHLAMHKLGGRCLFACEWDKDAQETYAKNYGIVPAGDITKISEREIPKHDVLCAGFPCQAFSKAGKQLGFADETKGTLFFDVERILAYHKTKYIVLENVRNLVSHDNGNTWKTIHSHLVNLGYRLTPEPLIVSPHYFGIPQLRERVVVLGIYDPKHAHIPLEIKLPKFRNKTECSLDTILDAKNQDPTYKLMDNEIEIINVWDEFYHGIKEKVIGFPVWSDWFKTPPPPPGKMPEWKRTFIQKNNQLYQNNKTFIDAWLRRHNNLESFTPTMRKMEWQCGTSVNSAWDAFLQQRPSGLRIKRPDCAPALVAIVQVPIIGKYRRRMTLLEAARLQSFDDNFIPCSNRHQAYKQFGNAVNVTVIKECAKRLFKYE